MRSFSDSLCLCKTKDKGFSELAYEHGRYMLEFLYSDRKGKWINTILFIELCRSSFYHYLQEIYGLDKDDIASSSIKVIDRCLEDVVTEHNNNLKELNETKDYKEKVSLPSIVVDGKRYYFAGIKNNKVVIVNSSHEFWQYMFEESRTLI